jgi:myo-inositol-1(or 4)-monophosphatase
MAAGILMVREAGGIVSDLSGGAAMLDSGEILAANGTIQKQMISLLKAT